MRTNHKSLHRYLESIGYSIYICDYSYGTHLYQVEKSCNGSVDHQWYEYRIDTKNKVIYASANSGFLSDCIKNYYNKQSYILISEEN